MLQSNSWTKNSKHETIGAPSADLIKTDNTLKFARFRTHFVDFKGDKIFYNY
ncbi:hypothetical protein FM107_10405 [Sphingobacterium sp. JB170]|nr:hypothetical protein FM107_10405 [Sphingobacterium sp. JB170]